MKIYAQIDASKIPILGLVAEQAASAPSSPVNGQIYYDTATNKLNFRESAGWITIGTGTPTGPAGGDLTGTYPNPTIANAKITGKQLALSLIPTGVTLDGVTGTAGPTAPALRKIGNTSNDAMSGAADLATISANLNSGDVDFNYYVLYNVGDPVSGTDAANKNYVDSVAQGLDAKQSVKAIITTTDITLSGIPSTSSADNVSLAAGDRVLVRLQPTQSQNGIYVVSSGAWSRSADADTWTELVSAFVFVEQGDTLKDTGWVCTVDAGGTLGTTAVTWTQFSGAGQIIAGSGLSKSGNTLSVANLGVTNAMIADGTIDLTAKVTGALPVANGGTGATDEKSGRYNLAAATWYTANIPALTAGTWTTVITTANLNAVFSSLATLTPKVTVNTDNTVVILDHKYVSGTGWQVKSDIAVAVNTLSLCLIGA